MTDSELHKQLRENRQRRRSESRVIGTAEVEQLNRFGFNVVEITPYQFRVTGDGLVIDIYPTRRRYHNIKTGGRGHYGELIPFMQKLLHIEEPK